MSQRRLWICVSVLAVSLAYPRTASAGIGEIILQMSGPQMIGALSGCNLGLNGQIHRCHLFGWELEEKSGRGDVWLLLESGHYISDGKNAGEEPNEIDFRGFQTFMLTFDPMVGFRSRIGDHAIGVSYNFVFGEHFNSFSNFSLKLRPVVVRWFGLDWEWNIRLYPNGFDGFNTPDGAGLLKGDDFEFVNGISVTLPLKL